MTEYQSESGRFKIGWVWMGFSGPNNRVLVGFSSPQTKTKMIDQMGQQKGRVLKLNVFAMPSGIQKHVKQFRNQS